MTPTLESSRQEGSIRNHNLYLMEYYGPFFKNYPCYSFLSGAVNIQDNYLEVFGWACCCQVTFLILLYKACQQHRPILNIQCLYFSCQSSGISVNSMGKEKNICVKGNQTLFIFSGLTPFLSYGFLQIRHLKWW